MTLIKELRRKLRKSKQRMKQLEREEGVARRIWTRGYQAYRRAASYLAKENRKSGTQAEADARDRVNTWDQRTVELTKRRDAAREAMAAEEAHQAKLREELAAALAREEAEVDRRDAIVRQVFKLNDAVVVALEARNAYLSEHVYRLLVKSDGTLRRQLTMDSKDELLRVTAMVNSITIVREDLATQAIEMIEGFFARFQEQAEMDEATAALYELTRRLLDIKASFKVGPDLYRFLSLELDAELFPELVNAQHLLKQSLRSEKTNSYIRLKTRKSRADNWEQVKQS